MCSMQREHNFAALFAYIYWSRDSNSIIRIIWNIIIIQTWIYVYEGGKILVNLCLAQILWLLAVLYAAKIWLKIFCRCKPQKIFVWERFWWHFNFIELHICDAIKLFFISCLQLHQIVQSIFIQTCHGYVELMLVITFYPWTHECMHITTRFPCHRGRGKFSKNYTRCVCVVGVVIKSIFYLH